jgi:hypothetical protein
VHTSNVAIFVDKKKANLTFFYQSNQKNIATNTIIFCKVKTAIAIMPDIRVCVCVCFNILLLNRALNTISVRQGQTFAVLSRKS